MMFMLSFPEKYKKNNRIPLKPFLAASMTAAERKRFKDTVEEITISYQIEGFDIPNLINDDYNCQAIAFLVVKIKNLKNAAFVGRIIQKEVKTLCVVEFTDGTNECWCFADKRLNKQDKNEIVVENLYITDTLPMNFTNDTKTLFSLYIDYESILNRSNKHAYYMEMMTKSYLIFNVKIYSNASELLDSKLWYSEESTLACYDLLTQLKQLKIAVGKTNTVAEKSALNSQIKAIMKQLEELK